MPEDAQMKYLTKENIKTIFDFIDGNKKMKDDDVMTTQKYV